MPQIIRFIKEWTLPLAIVLGAVSYFILAQVPVFTPYRPLLLHTSQALMPVVIFLMLFFTFCKIDPRKMRPTAWNGWLLLVQTVLCGGLVMGVQAYALRGNGLLIAEAALACLLAPTATAAAVIAHKLRSNTEAVTLHALLDNLWVAVLIAVLCPLLEVRTAEVSLPLLVLHVLRDVSPLLVLPLLLAWALRYVWPRGHRWCVGRTDAAFYLWGVALIIVMAQTMRFMVHAPGGLGQVATMCGVALVCCVVQFYVGRRIGQHYGDKIAAGQALGQKNTVFAIWMSYTFLSPLAAIAPGAQVVWQNVFNAWQLWRHNRQQRIS